MRSFPFPAMGTEIHVLLADRAGNAITRVRELFAHWESQLSRFEARSELSRLNARAGEPVAVGRLLFSVVQASVEAAHATGGAFDPTLLRQLERIGYDRPFALIPGSATPVAAPAEGGGAWRRIVLDSRSRTITLPEGCAVDLGGIAKGMAVDAALDLLERRGTRAALVSAGGDLAVRGLPDGASAWSVLVGDDPNGQVVSLRRGALATSGIARRFWRQGHLQRHHLVDPRTGEPAESGLREVTVVASSCKSAEVAATASFVLGPQLGAEFLRRHGLAGRFTRDDGSSSFVGPWPSPLPEAA
jgi:thiamine biosynthesis lipoprotein